MLTGEPVPADRYTWLAERFERRVHPAFIEVLRGTAMERSVHIVG